MTKDEGVVLVKDTPEFKQKMRAPRRKPAKSGQPAGVAEKNKKKKKKKRTGGQHEKRVSHHKKQSVPIAPIPGQLQRSGDTKKKVQKQEAGLTPSGMKSTDETRKQQPSLPTSGERKQLMLPASGEKKSSDPPMPTVSPVQNAARKERHKKKKGSKETMLQIPESDQQLKTAKERNKSAVTVELSPATVQTLNATAPLQPGVNLVPAAANPVPTTPKIAKGSGSGKQYPAAAPTVQAPRPQVSGQAETTTGLRTPTGPTPGSKNRHEQRSDDWAAAQPPRAAPRLMQNPMLMMPESGANPLRSAQLPPVQQTAARLDLNMDEVLRLGAVMDRCGCSPHKRIAFDWLARNRARLDQHAKTASEQLQAALGDVQCDRQLAVNAIRKLYRCGTLTVEECVSLVKIVESLRPPITIGQIAFLVHETALYYKRSNLQLQKS